MINLLNANIYKLRHSVMFRNLMIVIFIITGISITISVYSPNAGLYMMSAQFNDGSKYGFGTNDFENMQLPTLIELVRSSMGLLPIVVVCVFLLAGMFFLKEFTDGTIKNTIAFGHSRIKIYVSKFMVVSLGVLLFLVVQALIYSIVIGIFKGSLLIYTFNDVITALSQLLVYWFIIMSITGIFILLSVLVRNQAVVVGAATMAMFGSFFILALTYESIGGLGFNAFNPFIILMEAGSISLDSSRMLAGLGVCGLYIVGSIVLGCYMFKRQEIK